MLRDPTAAMAARDWRLSLGAAAAAGLLTAALLFALSLGTPFTKDQEAVYALDARSVLRGNWLLVHSLGRKPPLYVWLAALASHLGGGLSEVSARLPGVLAGGLLAAILFAWTARNLGRRAALMSWLGLLTMGGFVSNFVTVQVDSLMVLCVYAALIALHPTLGRGVAPARGPAWAGLALGAGMLAKGPIAPALVALSAAGYLAITRRDWRRLPSRPLLIAGAIAVAIAGAWYAAALAAGGAAFWRVVYEENLGHLLPGVMGGTGEAARPFYFILAHLLGASMPIVLFLPAASAVLWRESDQARRDFLTYATMPLWVVAILFSLASSKREVYVLPALPALALVIGNALALAAEGQLPTRASARLATAASAAFLVLSATTAALCAGMGAGALKRLLASARLHPSDRLLASTLIDAMRSGRLGRVALWAVAAALLLGWGLAHRRQRGQVYGAILTAMITMIVWARVVRPAMARARTEKYFLAEVAGRLQGASSSLMVLDQPDLEAQFYLDRNIQVLGRNSAIAPGTTAYLLTRANRPPPELAGVTPVTVMSEARQVPGRLILMRLEATRQAPP